jgi:CubicO group peptidase (beta-lactamase class C family)
MQHQLKLFLFCSVALLLGACNKDAPGPTPPPVSGYYYPPLSGTTWETVSAADLGWDQSKLNDLISYVDSNNSAAFIILYKGRIVTENYWRGFSATSSAKIFSASKSIAAFLTGLAEEQGKLDINKPVNDYLGIGWSSASLAQKSQITVKHLITMTSGLNEDALLSYDTVAGAKWYYNTLAYHKVYDVLAAAYGKSNAEYTNEQLWSKIGMQNSFWDKEPGGGPSMSCSGRDMARFGLMVLSDGKWNGEPIMQNTAYFQAMTNSSQDLNRSYGYLWWLNGKSTFILPGTSGQVFPGPLMYNAPSDLIAALGYGDKKIYVVKSKDLVVIRHGAPSNAPVTYALSNFDNEIWKRLMAAIQ